MEQYLAMSTEFNFMVIDANQLVEAQQATVRELVTQGVNLTSFRRAERAPAKRALDPHRKNKATEWLE